jgi:hypothetical protein
MEYGCPLYRENLVRGLSPLQFCAMPDTHAALKGLRSNWRSNWDTHNYKIKTISIDKFCPHLMIYHWFYQNKPQDQRHLAACLLIFLLQRYSRHGHACHWCNSIWCFFVSGNCQLVSSREPEQRHTPCLLSIFVRFVWLVV